MEDGRVAEADEGWAAIEALQNPAWAYQENHENRE